MRPAITTIAIGWRSSAPSPSPSASGTRPSTVVPVVIAIGRSRMRAPSMSASSRDPPLRRSWFTLSTRMIALSTTTPTSRIAPMNTITETLIENSAHREHDADQGERDREHDHERVQQRLELRRHEQVDEERREGEREEEAVHRPRRLLVLAGEPDGDGVEASRCAFAAPRRAPRSSRPAPRRSRPARSAETISARRPPTCRISAGPSPTSIVATARAGAGESRPGLTWRRWSVETVVRSFSGSRVRTSILRSRSVNRVATTPWTLLRIVSATSPSLGRSGRARRGRSGSRSRAGRGAPCCARS